MNLINSFKALFRGLLQMWWNLKSLKAAKQLGMEFAKEGEEKKIALSEDPVNSDRTNNWKYVMRFVSKGIPGIVFTKVLDGKWLGRWSTPSDLADAYLKSKTDLPFNGSGSAKDGIHVEVSLQLVKLFMDDYPPTYNDVTCQYDGDMYIITVV